MCPWLLPSFTVGAVYPAGAYYCNFWPARAVERYAGAFNNTLSNKILVIGNTVRFLLFRECWVLL